MVTACRTQITPLSGEKLFYVPSLVKKFRFNAVLDTGAFSSAIPLLLFKKIEYNSKHILNTNDQFPCTVKMADGTTAKVMRKIRLKFTIGISQFEEYFLVLENLNSMLLGLPLFQKNDILIHPNKGLLYLPETTLSLNHSKNFSKSLIIHNLSKAVIKPNQH